MQVMNSGYATTYMSLVNDIFSTEFVNLIVPDDFKRLSSHRITESLVYMGSSPVGTKRIRLQFPTIWIHLIPPEKGRFIRSK
jgi:hypothetical protein